MSYNQRIQELMNRGMSRQQAEANQRSAISQGMDLNRDGYVTDSEYQQWQGGARAGGGGGGHSSGGGGGGNSNWYHGIQNQTGVDFNSLDPELAKQALGSGRGWGHTDQERYDALVAQRGSTSSSHQQAHERAQNYSQQQANAASAQQQYDQSIAEWETAFNERDKKYTDDIKKMDEDYQKQFEDFERATALSMMDEGGSKKTFNKVKDNLLDQTDSYEKYNKFGNFDPTSSHKQRKYSFNQ